jgi:hypothetical protein
MKEEKIKSDFRKIFYYLGLVIIHYAVHYWMHSIFTLPFLKRICFLTNISLLLNTIYYTSMLIVHLRIIKFHKNLERGLFKFSYCISFVVFTLYWSMILMNPKLLNPGNFSLPILLDLFLHGANYLLNVVEMKFINPKENMEIKVIYYVLFCIIYGVLLKLVLYYLEWAVYPFVHSASHIEYFIILIIALMLVLLADHTYNKLAHDIRHIRHLHIHEKIN